MGGPDVSKEFKQVFTPSLKPRPRYGDIVQQFVDISAQLFTDDDHITPVDMELIRG